MVRTDQNDCTHIKYQRVQLWYGPKRISNDNPPKQTTTVYKPKNGVANRLIKQVGSYKVHQSISRIDQPEPITPPKTVRLTKPVSGLHIRPFCMLMPKCDGHFRPVCAITTGEDSNSACQSTSQKSSCFSAWYW